ncbi:bifunctional folylpolyglutamate synthase/dihydrofolate synthase [Alkalibacter mobilis]|uniref:bifunctional folylpolyglutamate synthase/dihydrofolate synthase n=1 Tax=Alkalibacter mobilis TaxID=2787712 RepID=UPI00189E4860|nr:folylpolyglutamate synthase/dihydrofolate synthase family protein [Alkalibacter mobilis]MBF7096881.1 bifunctional folylpolyglutamate synthase/dihydrofolate synthase [Alkalibacter mobilis]
MNYEEALEYISGTYMFGIKLGLENIGILLNKLNNPQDKLKYVHVAGTNGKGSTSHMIHYTLKESGYKVGLFISPFLEEFTERIQINGQKIEKNRLGKVTETIKNAVADMMREGHPSPSEFEVVTAIGLQYFYEENVDIVILEVGMGGRLDATNIIKKPEVSIITTIGTDHVEYLGNTLEKIAYEKAGIIKENCPVVIYPQAQSVLDVLIGECTIKNAPYVIPNFDHIQLVDSDLSGQRLLYTNDKSDISPLEFNLSLLGDHQISNSAVALTAIEILAKRGYKITPESIKRGMQNLKFTGRFEKISESPLIFIDGAHNLNGFEALVKTLDRYINGKINVVIGILGDKDYDSMLSILVPYVKKFYTVTPDSPRALEASVLSEYIKNKFDLDATPLSDTKTGAEIALQSEKDEVFLFVGSLYMIGEARTALNNLLNKKNGGK